MRFAGYHDIFKTKRHMQNDPSQKGKENCHVSILEGMNPLEVSRHVYGNVAIDGHADNDVHAPSHKAIQKWDHQMGLP